MTDEVLSTKLDHIQSDLGELKSDLREMKDGAPMHRISSLEEWRTGVNRFLVGAALAIIGAWAAVLFV